MKIVILSGSQRQNSQSRKVAQFAQALLEQNHHVETFVLDLAIAPLLLWTDHADAAEEQARRWGPIATEIRQAEGLVIVSPEWNGMSPPALKNFFLYCTEQELADKPGYIIGVSSGRAGGTCPAAELRVSSFKDTQICYIPEQLIVRNVRDVLNEPDPQSEDDAYVRVRMDHGLGLLVQYSNSLTTVRTSGLRNFELFPYGM
jgi:NAD(P)H-dependent FMN reductase